jgi:hypothetical protein
MAATGSTTHSRWQESFRYSHQALAQPETLFEPPALNEREQQGLIKAFKTTLEQRGQGGATLLRSRNTLGEAFPLEQLQQQWAGQQRLQAVCVWLACDGSCAAGRPAHLGSPHREALTLGPRRL